MKKINKKIILLLIVLISTLLIQGCENRRPTLPNYYQGYQGIEAEFLNNAPSKTVLEESIVSVMIKVWNRGAYTVPPEQTFINLRFNPIYFKLDTSDPNFLFSYNPEGKLGEIIGRSEQWPEGEYFSLPLTKLKTQEIPGTRESPTTNIELSTCYSYKTFFSEMICLDTDIYGVDTNPICRNQERYTYSNQGAPIAINKLEVDMLPMGFADVGLNTPTHTPLLNDSGELIGLAQTTSSEKLVLIEPVIRIYARNVGRGLVFIPKTEQENNAESLCSVNDENYNLRDYNKVKLTKVTLEGLPMDCGQKITLNLANPDDFITCKLHINQTGYLRQNLKVPLSIELDYYYAKSLTHQVKIQRTY